MENRDPPSHKKAEFLFAFLWLMGIAVCLLFRGDRHIWKLEE